MLPVVTVSSPEGFSAVPDMCWDLSALALKPCRATQCGPPRLPTHSTGPGRAVPGSSVCRNPGKSEGANHNHPPALGGVNRSVWLGSFQY